MRSEDQRSQLLFWDREEDKSREPSVYAVAVMTFGATCSPSSAQFVKNRNSTKFENRFPRAAQCIKEEHYVDDMLASVETETEAIALAEEVRFIHGKGGFEIRNWLSNSARVAAKLQGSEQKETAAPLCDATGTEKVLGMWWDTSTDEFTFRLSPKHDDELLNGKRTPSKREVLSTLMTVYDPMGLIGNFLMYVKVLLQEIWRTGIGWDEPLNNDLSEKWQTWIKALPNVLHVRVPRCYRLITSSYTKNIQLHMFCDASESGMAAAAYLRFEEDDKIECALIGSKTRVAPLKFVSIPRLELQAALIGVRFANNIVASHRITIKQVSYWTDSRDVICWLRADHRRYSQFVAFRVSEILETTERHQWQWISGKKNVADDGTKWKRTPTLDPTSRWFRGPDFLWRPEADWPERDTSTEGTSEEMRKTLLHHVALTEPWILIDRFSSWQRLVRTVAYVIRFVSFIVSKGHSYPKGPLTQPELERAECEVFILAQRDVFHKETSCLRDSVDPKHPWKQRIKRNNSIY